MNNRFCNGMIHQIKQGENLYQLSRKYRVPLALILRANPYVDVYNLQVGQEICIPIGRPFPGMRPPMPPQPQPREDMSQEIREEIQEEMEDVVEEMREAQSRKDEMPCFSCDGKRSLGEILEMYGITLSELLEMNDLNDMILAPEVVLHLPKKV